MPQPQFYYRDGEEPPRGPFLAEEMKLLGESGVITPDMFIRRGDGPWRLAGAVEGLFPAASGGSGPAGGSAPATLATSTAVPAGGGGRRRETNSPFDVLTNLQEEAPPAAESPATGDQLDLPLRTATKVRFSGLPVLANIYLVLAAIFLLVSVGEAVLTFASAFGRESKVSLLTSLSYAGLWLMGGVFQGAVLLTLSEACRVLLSLEKNQRLQADALADIRAVAVHRLRSESGVEARIPR